MSVFRLLVTLILGAVAVVGLGALTVTRGDGVDLAWASDLTYELQSTIWGLLLSGAVIWLLPLEWRDCYRQDLPASVRAAIPLALALVLLAVMGSMGTI